MTYKLLSDGIIKKLDSGVSFPPDLGNRFYQDYLRWLEEGNIPLPADPPPPPPPPPGPSVEERLEAAEALIDMMLEAGGEASNG